MSIHVLGSELCENVIVHDSQIILETSQCVSISKLTIYVYEQLNERVREYFVLADIEVILSRLLVSPLYLRYIHRLVRAVNEAASHLMSGNYNTIAR